MNYNCGPGKIPRSLLKSDDPDQNLAAALLFSSAQEDEDHHEDFCLQVKKATTALKLIRRNLSMNDDEILLILVDEFGQLERMRGETIDEALGLTDKTFNVAFVFSALTQANLEIWRKESGRPLYLGAKLTLLSESQVNAAVSKYFEGNANALKLIKSPRIQGKIRQCYGHPRCVD